MKSFLRSFSPFRWFKKGKCQLLSKACAQVLVNRLEEYACPGVSRLTDRLDMTLNVLTGPLNSNSTQHKSNVTTQSIEFAL